MKHENIYKLTLTALMAALSYVIFTFLTDSRLPCRVEMQLRFILAMLSVCWVHCLLAVYTVESAERSV